MKKFKFFFPLFITIISIYFLDIKELYEQTFFYVFQERDLERARNILKGIHIFFGPEMTGGGNLPGSLYYYTLAFVLKIYNNWQSAWWLQIIFFIAGITYAFYHLKKYHDDVAGFLWVIAISSAPLSYRFLQIFLNVSLLIPLCIISLFLINSSFSKIENSNRIRDLYLASFLIGLGLQFHYSIVILYISMLFLFIFASKLKVFNFNIKQISISFLLYNLPSIPYYIWSFSNNVQHEFVTNSGSSFNAIGSLIYLIRFSLHSELDGFMIESLRKILFTTPFVLLVFILAKLVSLTFKKKYCFKLFYSEFTPLYVCLIFSFIPYVDWYLSSQAVRYTMPFYICLNILMVVIFSKTLSKKEELIFLNWLMVFFTMGNIIFLYFNYPRFIISYYIITILIIATISAILFILLPGQRLLLISIALFTNVSSSQFITKDFSKITDYHWALFMPQTYEWRHIWNVIQTYTGWEYSESKNKIYYIGHHLEQSPSLYLENHKFKPVEKTISLKRNPDGFIISNRYRIQETNSLFMKRFNLKLISPKQWVLRQNIQPELRDAILNKDIIIGKNLSTILLIAPYWINDRVNLPDQIHNLGTGYLLNPEEEILSEIISNIGTKKISNDKILFKANECPSHRKYCSNGAIVSILDSYLNNTKLNIRLIGNTISQTSPWINPDWTQSWIKPSIEINCNDTVQEYLIVSSVGFLREGSHVLTSPLLQANNGFVAPISKTININCPINKIKAISLTREDSKIENINSTISLGAIKINYLFQN